MYVNSRLRALLPVADPEKKPRSPPRPLFLDQTAESRRAGKCFLRPAPPPISRGLNDLPPPLREGLDLPLITSILAHWSLTSHVPKYMRRLTKHEGTNIAAAVDLVFLWGLKLGSEGQFSLSLKGFFWAGELRGRGGGGFTATWDCTRRYGTGDNGVCTTRDRDLRICLVDCTLSFVCIFSTFLKNTLRLQKWKSRCN